MGADLLARRVASVVRTGEGTVEVHELLRAAVFNASDVTASKLVGWVRLANGRCHCP